MIKNYLKVAFRNMWRFKFFSFINTFGLAVGIACCTVIVLFVQDEWSYDRQHPDADRIYRVVKDFVNDDGSKVPDATTPPAIAMAIQKEIPEVEKVVRLFPGWGRKYYVRYGENKFLEENVYRADSSIFDVFAFPFVKGTAATAFSQLKAVVITESTAKKYFGTENPMGKMLEMDEMGPHLVTGVIKDIPRTTHFNFDFLISTRTIGGNIDANWGFYNFYTYIRIKPHTAIATVEAKIKAVFKKNQPENKNIFYTQALTAIHLHSNLKWELQSNGDAGYIYIIITIGLFIIIIACINYINLSTARSSLRAKEIGVRKVAGAAKSALIRQFIIESVLITLLAAVIALIIAQLVLPAINTITHKDLFLFHGNTHLLISLLGAVILIGALAGLYPAFYLSSFDPARVLKGDRIVNKTLSLRKILVVVQFVISIVLITGALVINKQVKYIQSAKLGFDKEQVVMINDAGSLSRSTRRSLKNEFTRIPGVGEVGFSDGIVGGQNWTNNIRLKGSDNGALVNFLNVDGDFIKALNLSILAGRSFSPEFPADTADGIILNETAVKQLGIPEPAVGKQIVWSEDRERDTVYYATVVGVVKDFHFTSLRNEIKPFAFVTDNNRQVYFAAKIDGKDVHKTMSLLQAVWDKNVSSRPFQYFFLDETYSKLYESERNFRAVFLYITGLVIIIACLGLLGLASFTTEQRTKEIGIRKVLGSSISGIVGLLSKDFVKLIVIAAMIAFPIAWLAMRVWLQDFAYRIAIGWWVFLAAGMAAILIALLTVSFQAIKAAAANPVKSLRAE
jgi:putative ABC transport system permease protein